MDDKSRFYQNYDAIRQVVILDTELEREGEIWGLSDLFCNTQTRKDKK